MISTLVAKVNNQTEAPIRVSHGNPTISWSFEEVDFVVPDGTGDIGSTGFIEQQEYVVVLGSSNVGLGTNSFFGDLLNTGQVLSADRQIVYDGPDLLRGQTYYGQVRVQDNLGNTSGWATFEFIFNSLPVALNANISPVEPSLTDDLVLTYTYVDQDGDLESGTMIRWFLNGVHQREFDDQIIIPSSELRYGQTWMADILPADGLEFGPRVTTGIVSVLTTPPVVTSARVLPQNANTNDILKADHELDSQTTTNSNSIRWFVNSELQTDFNDSEFARLRTVAGDKVHFEITPFDGVTTGETVSSAPITIQSSNFVVKDIRIDGSLNPLSVATTRPVITWEVQSPFGRTQEYVSILIGTAPGADNVFSTVVSTRTTIFQIPTGVLDRGRDYFISIAVNDTPTFEEYSIEGFRITGSRWSETVDNATGWTIEANLSIFGNIEPPPPPAPEEVDTTIAQASVIGVTSGSIDADGIIVKSGGSNYVTAPTVTITSDTGSGATAEATIDSTTGTVEQVVVTNGGSGYDLSTSPITVSFSGGQEDSDSASTDTSSTDDSDSDSDASTVLPEELRYQVIRFQDGTRFGEVRIFKDKISFASSEVKEATSTLDLSGNFSIRIHGQGDDVKVFLNKELIIDATGLFVQESSSKRLDVGAINGEVFDIRYRTIFYTTSGAFDTDPIDEYGSPNPFSDIQFHTFAEFKDSQAQAIKQFRVDVSDFKVVGVNPSNENMGGALYRLNPKNPLRFPTANRTFTPINKIHVAPNGNFVGVAHARGTSLMKNYPIILFDHNLTLIGDDRKLPNNDGWELYQNIGIVAASFDDSGLLIDTSFGNAGTQTGALI